jgi:hypothetical protein
MKPSRKTKDKIGLKQFAAGNLRFAFFVVAGGLIAFAISAVPAAAQSRTERPLDKELLKNLNDSLEKDLDRQLSSPLDALNKEQSETDNPPAGADLEERLKRELGAAAEKESDDPLLGIAENMFLVRGSMAKSEAGPATLSLQKQIVADMDRLIQQVCKSCGQKSPNSADSQGKSASNNKGSKSGTSGKQGSNPGGNPAQAGAPRANDGKPDKSNTEEMRAMMNNLWGELPARVREQMLQIPFDDFVPKYQKLIEDYFRDLSNEKKSGE